MSARTGVGAAGMAIVLTAGFVGCTLFTGSPATSPAPSQPASAATSSPPVTPTVSPASPSASQTAPAAVKASGQLSLYKNNLVTKAFTGTCVVASGKPTVTLADHKNDFYTTVDVTIVLSADGGEVASIAGAFGEDSEVITRKLVHPDKGTSALLVTSDGVYRISGKLMVYENESKTGTLIPYSITAKCAKSDWLG